MDNTSKKLLKDILICITEIDNHLGLDKIFSLYDSNLQLQDLVDSELIAIGETLGSLLKRIPNIAISNARKRVDVLHSLSLGYDDIENNQVWHIIVNHLPILRQEIDMLLS
jgi:uncharacterized protein with HEPN domain